MHVLRRLLLTIAAMCALAVPALAATPAYAAEVNVFDQACQGGKGAGSEACSTNGANPVSGSNGVIVKVSRIIAYIAGIAAILLMIIGGIMYVISDGDTGKVTAARNTVMYAAIGLVIVLAAQTIITFVLNRI